MSRIKKVLRMPLIFGILMISFVSAPLQASVENQQGEETVLVGRVSYIEGRLLRYEPDEADWVETVKDTPFGMNDALYSENDSKAEIVMPNNTWVRIDEDTQIQLIEITENITDIEVASGQARFYSKGPDVSIKVRTPFGYVTGPPETSFDVFVDDNAVRVTALTGNVYYVDSKTRGKFEVIAGSSSIIANSRQVTAGAADVDPYWDSWNADRDTLWAQRMRINGNSARYLPPELYGYAYVLEGCGRWERVFYDDAYYHFWRPIRVSVGWTPFSVGSWSVWYGDNIWVPYEPFGYVTHHYGNWVLISDIWYWIPPMTHVKVYLGHPHINIGLSWYPGRVAWIHHGDHVGWVPLAPFEPYYSHRRWGRRSIAVKNVNGVKYIGKRHRYDTHAVIIDRKNLYKVNNYQHVRVGKIDSRSIAERYQASPFLNDSVSKGLKRTGKTYDLNQNPDVRKPFRRENDSRHRSLSGVKERGTVDTGNLQEKMTTIRRNRVSKKAEVNRKTVKYPTVTKRQPNRSPLQGMRIQKQLQNDKEYQPIQIRKQMRQNVQPNAFWQKQETKRPVIDRGTTIPERRPERNLHVPNRINSYEFHRR